MFIGIIGGTGRMGSALAQRLAASGQPVIAGSRERARSEAVAGSARLIAAGSNSDAASAGTVIMTVPWPEALAVAVELREQLAGKTLITAVNRVQKQGGEWQPVDDEYDSAASALQLALPLTRVATAFNHLPAPAVADQARKLDADVMVCTDHDLAYEDAVKVIDGIQGLTAARAGSLVNAKAVEDMAAALLNARPGTSIKFVAQS